MKLMSYEELTIQDSEMGRKKVIHQIFILLLTIYDLNERKASQGLDLC